MACKVATTLVALAPPTLIFRNEKLTVTVSLGSIPILAGLQPSAVTDVATIRIVGKKSSLTMVAVAWPYARFALTSFDRFTKNVSFDSFTLSPTRATIIDLLVSPAPNRRVPLVDA